MMETLWQMMDAQTVSSTAGINVMRETPLQMTSVKKSAETALTSKTMNVTMETTTREMAALNSAKLSLAGTVQEVEGSAPRLARSSQWTSAWSSAGMVETLECMNVMTGITKTGMGVMKTVELNGVGSATMEAQFKKIHVLRNAGMGWTFSNTLVMTGTY